MQERLEERGSNDNYVRRRERRSSKIKNSMADTPPVVGNGRMHRGLT